jgi:putative oxidoreductase
MSSQSVTTTASPGRVLNIVLWSLQILLAAFFIFAGTPKVLGDPTATEMFRMIGFGDWFQYFTGAVEIAGGIGLLIPRLSGLAAGGLAITMIGATVTNIFLIDMPSSAPMTVLLAAVLGFMAWGRRGKTSALINRFTR